MVLAELGTRITRALQDLNKVTVIDEKVLNECLNEITRALLQSDVQLKLVMSMQQNIKKIVNLEELAAGHNKRVIIEKVRLLVLNLALQKPKILSRYQMQLVSVSDIVYYPAAEGESGYLCGSLQYDAFQS